MTTNNDNQADQTKEKRRLLLGCGIPVTIILLLAWGVYKLSQLATRACVREDMYLAARDIIDQIIDAGKYNDDAFVDVYRQVARKKGNADVLRDRFGNEVECKISLKDNLLNVVITSRGKDGIKGTDDDITAQAGTYIHPESTTTSAPTAASAPSE